MKNQIISTSLGQISVYIEGSGEGDPLVFMHGIFMDNTLWSEITTQQTARKHIYIDMPAHGNSGNVEKNWDLNDCVEMLMQVLDILVIERCILIGHSWGAMTGLRASHKYPSRFSSLGLFNMPYQCTTGLNKASIIIQKTLAAFPKFYATQAAKALYSKSLLKIRPELVNSLKINLSSRPHEQIKKVINAVILKAEDTSELLNNLSVPALAVVGEDDKICDAPPYIETIKVPGGHVSPFEAPEEIPYILRRIISYAERSHMENLISPKAA